MKHYLVTCWNVDLYDLGWLQRRQKVFERFTLPSVEGQKNKNFEWLLITGYRNQLTDINDVTLVGGDYTDRVHAAWLCTVLVEDRVNLQRKLAERGIESGQVHYRNDRYSIFQNSRGYFPNMDSVEDNYLVLPMHMMMDVGDVERVCDVLREGW
ncbi:MAG: DegT/DnrJ/EryC1/StrS family aminotransferase [Promethearchaeota archaeon]